MLATLPLSRHSISVGQSSRRTRAVVRVRGLRAVPQIKMATAPLPSARSILMAEGCWRRPMADASAYGRSNADGASARSRRCKVRTSSMQVGSPASLLTMCICSLAAAMALYTYSTSKSYSIRRLYAATVRQSLKACYYKPARIGRVR